MNDPTLLFKNAIFDAGLEPPAEIIADGEIHRFGKNKNSWYVFYNDNIPAGAFGNWATDLKENWHLNKKLSVEEKTAHKQRMSIISKQRNNEQIKRQSEAKEACNKQWNNADSVSNHAYLDNKKVNAYGLKQEREALLIPIRKNKELIGIQSIYPDGHKQFNKGGGISGGYHVIGNPGDTILIGEGYATLSSTYKATGFCSVIAFNAGNLKPVAEIIKDKFPNTKLILVADNDQWKDSNTGVEKATDAAKAIGAYIAIPQFKDVKTKPTDFNDLYCLEGVEIVKQQIKEAIKNELLTTQESPQNAIERLSKLSPIEYEAIRKEEANKLGFRSNVLDKMVNNIRPDIENDDSKGGREVIFNDCEMYTGKVTGHNVLDEVLNHIIRHMHINLYDAVISVLWSAHTHIYNKFNHTPRLIISAPEPECGKTVLLFHMIGNFSNKVLPTDNLSPAVFFRLAEKHEPTFLIDEGDVFINQDSDLIAGFNNGFEPHGGVYRCVGDEHEVRKFPTFAPLALAGIQLEKKLPPATRSRAFIIHLERVSNEISDSDSWDKDVHRKGLLLSRAKLARWIHDHINEIASLKPKLPKGLKNRSKDKWAPLFSIAQVAGGEWSARVLDAYNKSNYTHEVTKSEQFLIDVKSVIPVKGNIHTEALINALCNIEDSKYKEYNFKAFESYKKRIQALQISNLFKKYNIKPKTVRVGGILKKGYACDALRKIFERYIPKEIQKNTIVTESEHLTVTPTQSNDSKAYNDISPVTKSFNVTDKNSLKHKPANDCYPVTSKSPITENFSNHIENNNSNFNKEEFRF